jgi:hypothetical protein
MSDSINPKSISASSAFSLTLSRYRDKTESNFLIRTSFSLPFKVSSFIRSFKRVKVLAVFKSSQINDSNFSAYLLMFLSSIV